MSNRFRGCGHPARVLRFRLALFSPFLTLGNMSAVRRTRGHGTDRISLHWADNEVPEMCFRRRLCTKPGNIPDEQLPIAQEEQAIRNALNRYSILAITAEPAAGKSTQVPRFVYKALSRWNSGKRPCLCLVQKSVYACRKLKESLVEVFKWEEHRIQLKTANDDEPFSKSKTDLSIINYGILWEWMTSDASILRRYDALLLDEWADTGPKQREMGRLIRHMMQRKDLPNDFRLVLMSAALQQADVSELFGEDFGHVIVAGRNHTMERCVVMPPSTEELLQTAAGLAIAAINRGGPRSGDCIVFLPGIAEILEVQLLIKAVAQTCKIVILHSDCIDHTDEEEIPNEVASGVKMVVLSTIIGSRTVTMGTVRYAIIHPAIRISQMHHSGIMKLVDTPITRELEKNQEGRIARVRSGLATYLYNVDDTELVVDSASQGLSSSCCQHRQGKTWWLRTLSCLKGSCHALKNSSDIDLPRVDHLTIRTQIGL